MRGFWGPLERAAQPRGRRGGGSGLVFVFVFVLVLVGVLVFPRDALAQRLPTSQVCVDCHLKQKDPRLSGPARDFAKDIHAEVGLGCLDCHGGAGNEHGKRAMDPAMGFLGKPARRDIPALCGRCHSDATFMRKYDPSLRVDQVTEYWTSVHGQQLRQHNDPNVATCTNCHTAHSIRPPSDPASTVYPTNVVGTCAKCHGDAKIMAKYGLTTDEVTQYRQSVHGRTLLEKGDVSAPTCNDCHGNHGAVPPGVSSVQNVCGQCHAMQATALEQSKHAERFTRGGRAGCATCHGKHDIQTVADTFLVARTTTVCFGCHAENDPNGRAFLTDKHMLDSLQTEAAVGRTLLLRAQNAGMEVSEALFELDDVNDALTKARTAIHTMHVAPVRKEIDAGMAVATKAQQRGRAAMAEHRFRRVGLAISAAIILVLVLGLALKIRQIEARAEHHPQTLS
jgi:predicted CXXCH cytochrome family protein